MDFGILSSIKIDFSQVKIIFHRNRVRDLQPIQDAEWIFRNRRQEKKVGHDNKLLRNDVGQHFERRGQFYYPLDRSFKSVAVAQ